MSVDTTRIVIDQLGPGLPLDGAVEHDGQDQRQVVDIVNPFADGEWTTLVSQFDSGLFASLNWLNVLKRTYEFDLRAAVLRDVSGRVVAGTPFCRVDDPRGLRIVVLPFSDFSDPIVTSKKQLHQLFAKLRMEGAPVTARSLRSDFSWGESEPEIARRSRWHGLDLVGRQDDIWNAFDPQARQRVRRAQRNRVEVRVGSTESDLRAFFTMHAQVRKYKYRLLPQPYSFFCNIWDEFHDRPGCGLHLLLANWDGQDIAGTLFLEWGDTLYYKFNASLREHLGHRPNDLIIWEAVQMALSRGLKHIDFGLSDWDQDGLINFKRSYATEESQITSWHWPDSPQPALGASQFGVLLGEMTGLLTDDAVSDEITELGGNALYRFFA